MFPTFIERDGVDYEKIGVMGCGRPTYCQTEFYIQAARELSGRLLFVLAGNGDLIPRVLTDESTGRLRAAIAEKYRLLVNDGWRISFEMIAGPSMFVMDGWAAHASRGDYGATGRGDNVDAALADLYLAIYLTHELVEPWKPS